MREELRVVEVGFAGREESYNQDRVIRLLESIIVLFNLMQLISEFLVKWKLGFIQLNSRVVWCTKHWFYSWVVTSENFFGIS